MKRLTSVFTLYQKIPMIIRYLINSCITTIVDVCLVWVLLKIGLQIVAANSIGVVTGFLLGYILSFIFVWDNAKSKSGFVIFFITFLLGLVLADYLIWLGDTYWFAGLDSRLRFLASKGISIVVPFFVMYFLRKYLYGRRDN